MALSFSPSRMKSTTSTSGKRLGFLLIFFSWKPRQLSIQLHIERLRSFKSVHQVKPLTTLIAVEVFFRDPINGFRQTSVVTHHEVAVVANHQTAVVPNLSADIATLIGW